MSLGGTYRIDHCSRQNGGRGRRRAEGPGLLTEAKATGKKLTAAALKAVAKRLGYATATAPAPESADTPQAEQRRREEAGRKLTAAADAAERALALYEAVLAAGVAPADTERAAADLARLTRTGRVLSKQNRLPGSLAAPRT